MTIPRLQPPRIQFTATTGTAASPHQASWPGLADVTAAELDLCWAVNVRATVLLVQALVAQPDLRAGGRVVLFSSGQHHSPMPDELPYSLSKAALAGATLTLAAAVAPHGVSLNAIDPGPTDTGYADPEAHASVAARIPFRRWGQPADVANLVAFLVGPEGGWVTGQLVASDGGWMLRTGVTT
jgi:3-oxoacyl-[acyl-carrier protein] reductase